MNRKKVTSIIFFIGAVIVLAAGAYSLYSGHDKTGLGLLVLGVIAIAIGIGVFISSNAEERQTYKDWIS